MKKNKVAFFRTLLTDQRGQSLAWVAAIVSLTLSIGGGLGVDLGRAYVVRSELQNYANAMALAAAGEVYNTSLLNNATAWATTYSASQGHYNYNSGLGSVTPTITPVCVNMLLTNGGTCSSSSPANAIKIAETTTISTYFMKLFGVPRLTVTANATASTMGAAQPWNVAILVDATASMASTDSNCGGLTEFKCAEQGIQTLLASVNPCKSGYSSCTAASHSQFRVTLFQMPNAKYNSSMYTSPCSIGWSNVQYTLPITNPTSSSGYTYIKYSSGSTSFSGTYQISNWTSGYFSPGSSSTGGLNTSDPLIAEIGYTNSSGTFHAGCLPDNGGESSYHAGAIYAAIAALKSEETAVSNSQNAIIFLSDAQAQATSSNFPGAGYTASPNGTSGGYSIASSLSSSKNLVGGTKGTYPDFNDECQQTIVAAQAAKAAGIRVYSVAYGSQQSGCTSSTGGTDSALVLTPAQVSSLNYNFGSVSNLTPCITMENVASSLSYFYSDYNQSGSGSNCEDASHTVVSLKDIFLSIAGSFTNPRLLPNNATYVVTSSQ
jgi:hypothetical protein